MLKDKIVEIIKTLSHLTGSGVLKWNEESPLSNTRQYKRKMFSEGEDGTKYEMEIKFSLKDDKWELDQNPDLWIRNKSLPDGMMYVTTIKSNGETKKLRDAVLDKYCTDMTPSIKEVEDVLTDIARGISITEFREGRLNKILN